MGKKYQNDKLGTSRPVVPERVSVALAELAGEVQERVVWPGRWALGCRC